MDFNKFLDFTKLGIVAHDLMGNMCYAAEAIEHRVAGFCVMPKHVQMMDSILYWHGIPVITVANFPSGDESISAVAGEIRQCILNGAEEIDLVFPYNRFLAGDIEGVEELLTQAKAFCEAALRGPPLLKIIMESEAYSRPSDLKAACRLAIECGADFLKTSTGKLPRGADIESARIMLGEIKASGLPIGFKASGNIRTQADARRYFDATVEALGDEWATPSRFRIGSSQLLK